MFDFNDKRRLSPVLHPVPAGVSSVCIFGADGKPLTSKEYNDYEAFLWRPYLERQWGRQDSPLLLFVLMNPSSANAAYDDNSTRRCLDIAERHGFGGMIITDIWSLRSTGNERLLSEPGAAGDNMAYLQIFTAGDINTGGEYYRRLMTLKNNLDFVAAALKNPRVTKVYCGWGEHKEPDERQRLKETAALLRSSKKPLVCASQNEDGSPKYVLYTPVGAPLVPFEAD